MHDDPSNQSESPAEQSSSGGRRILPTVAKFAVPVILLFAAWNLLPLQEWIDQLRGWIESLGPIGGLVFAAIYAVASVLLVPGSVLSLAAGVAFGLWGIPIVVGGATVGAALAFLIARTVARERVERAIEGRERFQAVDRAVEEEGWKVVALMRLSPAVPFNLQNYFFGATSVSFVPYVLATFFGILPGTALYVWIGSLGGAAAGEGDSASTARYVFLGVGLVATAAVTWFLVRKSKQKLGEYGVENDA